MALPTNFLRDNKIMGLDMYLTKETYVKKWSHQPPEETFDVTVNKGGNTFTAIKPDRVREIVEEVAYWRKANAIHQWFVDNVQDGVDECQKSHVSVEQLEELLGIVEKILVSADREATAKELLPTQSGFFFGSTEYDEWYFHDLETTKSQLIEILADDNSEADFYYRSSW